MRKGKRAMDLLLAVPALIVLSPLFVGLCLWVKLDSPGAVFFRQKRVGIHKTYFEILKFRTMRSDTPKDVPTHLLKDPEQYITRAGKFLRKTSLDELPQLLNIIRGEMSIVGPRPALWNQYDLLRERDRYGANDVLPGLTGWAQIHGRDTLSIAQKAKLDGYYVEHQGFWMDLRCIFLTVISVLKHDGVQEGGTGAVSEAGESSGDQIKADTGEQSGSQEPSEVQGAVEAAVAMDYPLVSVVVATYRRRDSLKRALASLFRQTYNNLEILLVDDNANPVWNRRVRRIAESGAAKSGCRVVYIQNEKNLGSAASRNAGIQAAKGRYVTFLDDDDVYLPDKIKRQLEPMLRERADYSITDLELYSEQGKLEERRVRRYLEKADWKNTDALLSCHLMYHMTGTDTLMFRTDYLRRIGGFPPIDVGDEFYLMEEAILGGGRGMYVPGSQVRALVHRDTEGLSSRQGKIDGENALYERKKEYFPMLPSRAVRFIRMRHHMVLAYAQLRQKHMREAFLEGAKAVSSAPVSCVAMILSRRRGR